MSKNRRKPRSPGKPLWYKQDARDRRQIILKNGTRLRQAIIDVDLYLSQGGNVYSLTRFGLRQLRVNFGKKNNYCKPTRNGNAQGECYPYINFRARTYRMHKLMALAWCGGIPDGFVADHINGDIDDFRLKNIRVISIAENNRCGGILRRLRNAAVRLRDPTLDPLHIPQERLLKIFADITV
jgi:hypothetical protein